MIRTINIHKFRISDHENIFASSHQSYQLQVRLYQSLHTLTETSDVDDEKSFNRVK
jgi:hypothetical protein